MPEQILWWTLGIVGTVIGGTVLHFIKSLSARVRDSERGLAEIREQKADRADMSEIFSKLDAHSVESRKALERMEGKIDTTVASVSDVRERVSRIEGKLSQGSGS